MAALIFKTECQLASLFWFCFFLICLFSLSDNDALRFTNFPFDLLAIFHSFMFPPVSRNACRIRQPSPGNGRAYENQEQ